MPALNRAATGAATRPTSATQELELIEQAIRVLERRMFRRGKQLKNPQQMGQYLRLKLGRHRHEVFAVIFLDAMLRVIAFEELFQGSVNSASVQPRVVLQRAMHHNAVNVVLSHNHPSGNTEPSVADRRITVQLKLLLSQVDVHVLDHIIVGKGTPYSLAQAGLI
ncbi:TPA: DNA repair protein RadC [Pseudomonas aeruginosa]|uniref:JAB domain-containing protein n=1 Tax=Pseudomonas aeruginosa TaxID=287 RepID=UPI0007104BCA|nr:JAB domain-containing protein [Pseudomonas aeruginosa]EKV3033163.1 DNA repair protein RadC [Pseudomonas aeruginosa]EKV3075343.1 DNA repair protein RadC [Pseudomonas aeruginosa]MBK1492710.1 DNA repair protein RadC [Pseudomonas aeruginosa]MCO3843606.1 DNA repair protein RadC [Pseudomonas aeruginosa]MCT4978719.1 DNA repair protein RadC [Pseudomonas aeruginosa]